MPQIYRTGLALVATAAGLLAAAPAPAAAQWVRQSEQFYLPASHNWVFRRDYPQADRLFNAFDYGHAILYEELYRRPEGPVSRLEQKEFDFLTRRVLNRPPRVPLEEGAIEVAYAKLAPEAKLMFEWAHILHRQLYDVLADERLSQQQKDAAVAEVLRYYRTRPDLAFSARPKSMELMDGQYYSLVFRQRYPKFNGLIWAYHWLQVGLYEPLLQGRDMTERQTGVTAAVARFRQMLEDAPAKMPHLMPMTAAIAPQFAARYPEAAIVFDNLHMMHDVVSDILASPEVPQGAKRQEILRAARLFRDDTSYVTSVQEWREMAVEMGVHNQGGPAWGIILTELPRPTVAYGQSMAGMEHGAMEHTGAAGQQAGMQHGQMQQGGVAANAGGHDQHGNMPGMQPAAPAGQMHPGQAGAGHAQGMQHGAMQAAAPTQKILELHARMLDDPVIRRRVMADTAMRRLLADVTDPQGRGHPGMTSPAAGMPGIEAASAAERQAALEFIVRLLSDPQVEARIHSDPQLHRLWVDPEVQARLRELRQAKQPPTAPQQHNH